MARRLTGAALQAKVIREIRTEMAEDYGLPMGETAGVWNHSIGSDYQPDFSIKFRRANGRTIQVDGVIPHDDGTIDIRLAAVEMR